MGRILSLLPFAVSLLASALPPGRPEVPPTVTGNPILPGWYADPEVVRIGKDYWIFPTFSAPYDAQDHLDAFVSRDLVRWEKRPRILDTTTIRWARRALWAPSILEQGGRCYLYFSSKDIQNDQSLGGIGVAVAERPGGPYRDLLGKPLVDRFHQGAQPIDPFVFKDTDGTCYLIYGGWRHCNIMQLKPDFTGTLPLADGQAFREITPEGYVEGPFMFRRGGKYYFMWSEGGWGGPDYAVAYGTADAPTGPFRREGVVLRKDPAIATGAGHHSVLHLAERDEWYIVYHRRPLGETDPNHRVVCIDRMHFDTEGRILPVRMTFSGVEARVLPKSGKGAQ